MKEIIEPIDRGLIKEELSSEVFLRYTRKGGNEIYVVNANNAPNTLKEIGRLREIAFRAGGGGTGESLDLDEFDTNENCYEQLIVWSPEDEEIVSGYRYIRCDKAIKTMGIELSTAHYFNFSSRFLTDYLPNTIELGRSWVNAEYQHSVNARKGLYALDNVWDGLGAITVNNPEIKFFFGKVTMYPSYNREARNFLLHFLHYYFSDNEQLIVPIFPLKLEDNEDFNKLKAQQLEYKDAFKQLNSYVRERGEIIPPLVNIYMNLSPTMKTFGTAINPDFGNVEETGILVTIADVYPDKKERHMNY